MNFILSIAIGYLLGSIPTAYLIIKKIKKINITENGSQNVGALNSYKVSDSKFIGVSVLLIDAFKGFLSVLLVKELFPNEFIYPVLSLTAAVIGHCFSPWINFKGGRGLATTAGGAIILTPAIFIIWVLLWTIAFLFRKSVHLANIMATILTLALVVSTSKVFIKYSLPPAESELEFLLSFSIILVIILVKHWKPLLEWFGKQKKQSRGD